MKKNASNLKTYILKMKENINFFTMILLALVSLFIIDQSINLLKLNTLDIVITAKEDSKTSFVPDCLGFRGGYINEKWVNYLSLYKKGNWEIGTDGAYHMIENDPITLGVNCDETVQTIRLVFNCGPTQGIAEIHTMGQTFFFDCYNETLISHGTSYTLPITQEETQSYAQKQIWMKWILTIIFFILLIFAYNFWHSNLSKRLAQESIYRKLEIVAFILAPLVIGLFLANTSHSSTPLIKGYYGSDASGYSFYAKAWARGQIPYRDFFCNKGPILYAIFLANAYLGEQWGIFLVQCLAMWASMTAAYQIAKTLGGGRRLAGVLSVIGIMCFYCIVHDEGAIIEEFELPVIFWCLYLITKYMCNIEKQVKHPPKYALFYGLSFGYMLGMRASDGIYFYVFVIWICIHLLIHKEFKNLFHNALSFLIGTGIIVIPFILYFAYYGALHNFIQAYTVNFYYAGNGGNWSFEQLCRIFFYLTPVWMCIPLAFEQKPILRNSIISGALGTMLWLYKCNLFTHYYVIVLPFISIYSGLFMIRKLDGYDVKAGKGRKAILPIALNRYSCVYLFIVSVVFYAVMNHGFLGFKNISNTIHALHSRGVVNNSEWDEPSRELLSGIAPEDQDSVVIFNVRYDLISLPTGIYPDYTDFGGQQWMIDFLILCKPGMTLPSRRELYENIPYEKLPKYIVYQDNDYLTSTVPMDVIYEYLDAYYSLDKQVKVASRWGDLTMYLYKKL